MSGLPIVAHTSGTTPVAGIAEPLIVEQLAAALGPNVLHATDLVIGDGPTHHDVTFAPVPGATDVEVDAASVSVGPVHSPGHRRLQTVSASPSEGRLRITIPGGAAPIRRLHLDALTMEVAGEEVTIQRAQDLGARRLVVAPYDPSTGAIEAPWFAVPQVARRRAIPAQLRGASFSGGWVSLPDPVLRGVAVSVVDGSVPEDFRPVAVTVGVITIDRADVPREPTVEGPDGTVLWAAPSWLLRPAAAATVDLRAPAELALRAALEEDRPLTARFTIDARTRGRASVARPPSAGTVGRRLPKLTVALELAPRSLPLPPPRLPDEAPTTVTADVTIRYHGVRLHDSSDVVPPVSGAVTGVVVADAPVTRPLPPVALHGERVARVGLVGRAAEDTELSVRLLDADGGGALGDPGVASLPADPGPALATHWIEVPSHPPVAVPVTIEVTARRGRFLWCAPGSALPLVRIAVHDPDPGGRPLQLGPLVVPVTANDFTLPAHDLPPVSFRGTAPVVASDLVCNLELRHLDLRYRR